MDDFVIHYSADLSTVTADLRKLERINSQVAKEFGNDFVKASQVVTNSLDKISQTTVRKKVGKEFKDLQKTVIQTGTVVKLTNGEFRKFAETQTFLNGKMQPVKTSLTNVTNQVRKQEEAAKKSGKATKSFAENMKFLGKRALTVIPIWLVLRSVFTGFTRLLTSSLKFLIDWEFQLAQIKIVGKDSANVIDNLSDSMLHLASSLGISNEQLGEAAKLFIQQGRAASQIIPLLDATAKLSLLTGRTTVQSVEDLTAILKAFNIDAEKSITIVDLITNVMLCFDPETELLTDNGWKTYETISKNDKVFSLNLNNKKASYEKIDSVFINKNYSGKMLKYSNKIDFMVTPNHKFPIASNNSRFYKNRSFNLREIQNTPNQFNIPSNCIWNGKTIKKFIVPKYEISRSNPRNKNKLIYRKWPQLIYKMNDWLEFLGWYISEGSICGQTINISQYESVHAKEVKSIKKLLKRMKIDYRYDRKQFWLKGNLAQLKNWLKENCYESSKLRNCYSKSVPNFIKKLSSKQIKIFLDAFLKGDGTTPEKHAPLLYTASRKLKDGLLELILKTGKTPSYKKHGNVYHIIVSSKSHHSLYKKQLQYIHYKGLIWCVETNPNHTIYARRNGTCYWSGNSNAITAADLAAAYKQVASTAAVLGVSLGGLTGYITAIKAETRDAGGKIGLALRTMFTRITTVSADAIQQLADIPLFLDEGGKATKTATNRFRNLEEVMSELSLAFAKAGDAHQIQLAKLVAGVRRTNQAIVLFKNFNQVIKAQTDALLGLGKADKAIEILIDTSKLRIQSLSNAWKEFVDTVGDTGAIKDALNFLKNQIQGLNVLLDPRKAFFLGLQEDLRELGQGFQRNVQLAKNFTELLSITGNLSKQLGLAESVGEFDLINDRARIIFEQIQAFNRISPDIKIDITPEFIDAEDINKQLEAQREKFVDIQVQAQVNFERTQLQSQFTSIGREFQQIFTNIGASSLESMAAQAPEIYKQFKEMEKVIEKISKGEFIKQSEMDKVVNYSKSLKLTEEQAEGIRRKFDELAKTQNKLGTVSSRNLDIRKEINRQVDREIAKRRTAEQVAGDLFKAEIKSISENKTKKQLLEDQLEILERTDQVLTDQLENQLKSIRKELEKINAVEEQRILKVIINDQVERLRLAGALNSEILKRRILLEDNFKINRTESENLSRQLELEREINKEKLKQKEASSETLALFKLAQKFGPAVAGDVLKVLRGDRGLPKETVSRFDFRAQKILSAMNEFFPSVVEATRAVEYFTEGLGRFLPTKEKGAFSRQPQTRLIEEGGIWRQQAIAVQDKVVSELKLPKIETRIDQIKIELKQAFSDEQLSKQIVDSLAEAIRNNENIKQAIDDRIENY